MKVYRQLLSGVLAAFALIGCTDDNQSLTGEGKLMLNVSINSEIQESRAVSSETHAYLSESLVLWITDKEGNLVREYEGMANIPSDGISLACGDYFAEAWAGKRIPASFEDCWYQSEKVQFTIANGGSSSIELNCKIANAVVKVEFADDINEYLENYALTVRHEVGKVENGYGLVFPTDNYTSGYFSILSFTETPAESNNLYWSFVATNKDGGAVKADGSSFEIKKAHGYTIKISTQKSETSTEFGGGLFNIEIDEEPLVTEKVDIELLPPPIIKYRNGDNECDIDEPLRSNQENIGEPSLWIFAASGLTEVSITSELLRGILANDATSVNLREMASPVNNSLENNGLHYEYTQINGTYRCELSFKKTFISQYIKDEGSYDFLIKAKDESGKQAIGTFRIIVSNDPVYVNEVPEYDIWSNRAIVTGGLMNIAEEGTTNNEVSSIEVYYTKATDIENWSTNPIIATINESSFSANITGLESDTEYRFKIIVPRAEDNWESEVYAFTTAKTPQLPNAGFEEWQTSSSPYLIYPSGGDMFWDSGNHGSATMKKNVTVPDSDVKHSGNYSVKLESQFVGIGIIGKFAAGNVFIGKYLGTDGTDGIIGFGRSFTGRPKALKGYVKYEPGTVKYTNSGARDIVKGQPDKGIIYMALLDGTTDSEYPEFPVVVKTKTQQLFDKEASNVIAYGELVFEEATADNGLVKFTIDFDYKRTDIIPSFIMITAAASKGGDYFAGGNSTMWLDDFELVYE